VGDINRVLPRFDILNSQWLFWKSKESFMRKSVQSLRWRKEVCKWLVFKWKCIYSYYDNLPYEKTG